MRKLFLSLFFSLVALALTVGPVLADNVGPTPK
jgi:hypothetical protein